MRSGTVAPGMHVHVPSNSATSITLRIAAVGYWEGTQDRAVWLECHDAGEAEMVNVLDVSDEEFSCETQDPSA